MARPATAAVRLLAGDREPVRLATTGNIPSVRVNGVWMIAGGMQTIDGVATAVGDRILVKDQTDASLNGIYTASNGYWYRAADARTARTMQKGTTVHVQDGATNSSKTFAFQTSNPAIGNDGITITFYTSDNLVGDAVDALEATGAGIVNAAQTASSAAEAARIAAQISANAASAVSGSGAFTAAHVGAPSRSNLARMRETFSIYDVDTSVGSGNVANDTAALAAFAAYAAANSYKKVILEGDFLSSAALTIGSSLSRNWDLMGKITFSGVTGTGLTISGIPYGEIRGSLHVVGPGSNSYASRTMAEGILITNCGRTHFSRLRAEFCKTRGVRIDSAGGNTSMPTIDVIQAYDCGPSSYNTAAKLETVWSTPVNSGSSGSQGQRTKLNVTIQPPELLSTIVIEGYPYTVMAADSGLGTIDIYPWLASAAVPGTAFYLFGAAVDINGGDSSVCGIGLIDTIRCSVGLADRALYGAKVGRLVTQLCGVGYRIGSPIATAHVGGSIDELYTENNIYDILRMTASALDVNIHNAGTLSLGKCFAAQAPRLTAGSLVGLLDGIRIGTSAKLLQANGKAAANGSDTASAVAAQWGKDNLFNRNSGTVPIATVLLDENRLFGTDSGSVTFAGSGVNDAPTGTFTFTPPAGWTVNGVASVAYSGLTGPTRFEFEAQFATLDVKLVRVGNSAKAPTIIATNAAATLTPGATAERVIHTGTLTADRAITLSTTGVMAGQTFRVTRTGGGAFNLSVGGLKNLVQNTWCEVVHDGSAYVLTAYGAP